MSIESSLHGISASLAEGDLPEAERRCRAALQDDDRNPFIYLNLAMIAYHKRSFDEADSLLSKAAGLDAENANIHAQHCEVLRCLQRFGEAERAARKALSINAQNVDAMYNLSVLYGEQERNDEAIALLQAVLEHEPAHGRALYNLGVLHDQSGSRGQAEHFYRQAIAANPAAAGARRNLASLLFDQGDHDEARDLYGSLIRSDPNDVDAHFAYSRLTRYRSDDPLLGALQKLTGRIRELPWDEQVKLCFTVGKAHQDLGEYAAAFAAFEVGNDLHYSRRPYDEAGNFAMLDDVRHCFDADTLQRSAPVDAEDAVPVFVLGMPRSGSTLVEQVLASHSRVVGAGELKYLQQSIQEHLIGDRQTFRNAMPGWTPQALQAAATDYLGKLRRHGGDSAHIVDKMPGNFAFVGLITRLLPNARIIHTVRHPAATLWSNYSTHFGDALYYTYRLDVLCRYFEKYRAVMAHWRSVLPDDAFYDLRYEQLVRDPEGAIRGLLDYVGLSWEPACLDFHETRREVRTASVAQVRQPLYSSSVDTWQHYREQLRPYLGELLADQK